jgi:hypothetical protein
MRLRLSRTDVILLPFVVIGLAGLVYVAFRTLGFLGLAILGLITGIIAVNVEMQQGGPIGSVQATGVYAEYMAAADRMTRAEKAERRAEIESAALPLLIAKIVSAGLIILGFGLFFTVQLGS